MHGIYIGPLDSLHGHGALLRRAPDGHWLAQFDDLKHFGESEHSLALGWHWFARSDFGGVTSPARHRIKGPGYIAATYGIGRTAFQKAARWYAVPFADIIDFAAVESRVIAYFSGEKQ